jgi:hypothetical protein
MPYISAMKNIITAIIFLAATAMPALADPAAAQPIKPLDRTQEYRLARQTRRRAQHPVLQSISTEADR